MEFNRIPLWVYYIGAGAVVLILLYAFQDAWMPMFAPAITH